MTNLIQLTLRNRPDKPIAAPKISLDQLGSLSEREIAKTVLEQSCIGDWFDVQLITAKTQTLRLIGDLSQFDQIGASHSAGRVEVQGSVGKHAFAAMSGGEVLIDGNVGDHLGSPIGEQRIGMTGGRVVVSGNVGARCGHRMRRGHVWIGGVAGEGLAAFMIAGTIVVAADSRKTHLWGYGMTRGTILVPRMPDQPINRFSQPRPIRSVAINMLTKFISSQCEGVASIRRLADRFDDFAICSRGDQAVDGQAEIWSPPELASPT